MIFLAQQKNNLPGRDFCPQCVKKYHFANASSHNYYLNYLLCAPRHA